MDDKVWLLWFERQQLEGEDTELLIGVYRTEDAAREAIERIKKLPGFRDYEQGFNIYPRSLDNDSWTEGFVKV